MCAPGRRLFAVVRGNGDNAAEARKFRDLCVLTGFMGAVGRAEIRIGSVSILVSVPDEPGDHAWVERNVTSWVDIQRADTPDEAAVLAGRMAERLAEAGGTPDMVGTAFLRYHLDRMYMHYDEWSD